MPGNDVETEGTPIGTISELVAAVKSEFDRARTELQAIIAR